MKKKLLSLLLAIFASIGVALADASGTCGDNLQWSYNSTTHELTITGSGAMTNWGNSSSVPWYQYRYEITSVSLPNGLTSIRNNAFEYCTGLTSITIPNSVTSIGNYAFSNCTGLTSVTIPNSVTSIGNSAFSNVANIVYNGTATGSPWGARSVNGYVDGYLVYNDASKTQLLACSSLAIGEIDISNSVTSIGRYAFYGCSGLTSVTIPNSVTSIGRYAFAFCTGLTSITIPNSVTSIGKDAFYNCTGLTSVTIPNSVTSIGESAFSGCTGLTSVTIPNSVTSIGKCAFYNCTGLTSVTIPNSVTSIGESAFNHVANIVYNGSATGSPWGARSVNGYVDGYLVYNDASKTQLLACSSAATGSITIPNSVTSIGDYAFRGCTGLTSVTIPNSVTSIGNSAFSNVANIVYNGTATGSPWGAGAMYPMSEGYLFFNDVAKSVLIKCLPIATGSICIPNSVTTINDNAFENCSGITEVILPNSVTSIGDAAFASCTGLTSVIIPESVTSVGGAAFGNCTGLTYVEWNVITHSDYITNTTATFPPFFQSGSSNLDFVFGEGVERIPGYVLSQIGGINSVTIPNSVTSIGNAAFNECKGLTSVIIPNSVTSIGQNAFSNCTGLTSVTIPEGITQIKKGVFYGCQALSGIIIPSTVTSIGEGAFNFCKSLTSVIIPESVTSVGKGAFSSCKKLTSMTIPNRVTKIGDCAFQFCTGLTNVTIGNSVTSIGKQTFDGCTSLTSVTMLSETPPTRGAYAFPSGVVYYVPCGTLSQYQSAGYYSAQYQELNYALTANATQHALVNYIPYSQCEQTTQITVVPDYGYEFVQWNDGNTDNPRNVTMIGDLTLTAEIVIMRSGHCGNDNALTWTYNPETFTLIISGEGQLNDNYTYGVEAPSEMLNLIIEDGVTSIGNNAFHNNTSMISVIIPNSVTSIEEEAFSGCTSLTSVSIGENVRTIGNNAFKDCVGLENIYCYNILPPNAYSTAFDGVDKLSCLLQVPMASVESYRNAIAWRDFYYLTALGAELTEVTTLIVIPHEDNADVVWPAVDNATTYELTITSDGNTICTLIFNAQGQLTSITFRAPALRANGSNSGFRFNVTGLQNGNSYNLVIKAKDSNGTVLQTFSQDFTTGATALENINADGASGVRKVIEDGKVVIVMPDGRKFDASGKLLK